MNQNSAPVATLVVGADRRPRAHSDVFHSFSSLLGDAPAFRSTISRARAAGSDVSVLIEGETGTGKELIAQAIHLASTRAAKPFVAVNCGAIPENLVESEFFGHRKGSFTGADSNRAGLFEVANGGTLFLDELGELDKSMQVKLLRFLESGEVRRVGENDAITVDVRVVCATNRDLEEMVHKDDFREDLFFRVNTFEIHLPPLRERKDDIPSLARALVARHLKRAELPPNLFTPAAVEALKAHDWNGNVREMANAVEHAAIMADGGTIDVEHLPMSVTRRSTRKPRAPHFDPALAEKPKTLREIEMEMIHAALERNHGDKPRTALELGIALKTLYNKLNTTDKAEAS